MPQRRFLVASSLARLIRKERGMAGRIVEGYFPPRPDRDHFVSLEPGHAYLVLAPLGGAEEAERTEVPRSQAEALLAVCAGKVGFEGTIVPLRDGRLSCSGLWRPGRWIFSASSSRRARTRMGSRHRPGLARR